MTERITHPQPNALEMLALAAKNLRREVVPHLKGSARYEALLVASAMDTAVRELQLWETHDQEFEKDLLDLAGHRSAQDLCRAIRNGEFDSSERSLKLFQLLEEATQRSLRETHPDGG